MKKFASSLVLASTFMGSGLLWAQQPQMTPEQAIQMLQALRAAQGQQSSAAAPVATAPASTISEADLAAQVGRYPATAGIQFEEFPGGFRYNGQAFLDPEGRIVSYRYNTWTGDVSYVLEMADGTRKIKFVRPAAAAEPTLLATARPEGYGWLVTTVTGKIFSGSQVLPSSRGFVVSRDSALFLYTPGESSKTVTPPQGFQIAALQSGDVASTGFLLLERLPQNDGGLGKFKSLGARLGVNRKEDYALFNIASGQIFPLNISLENKQTTVSSNCQVTNAYAGGSIRMNKRVGRDSCENGPKVS